MRDVHGGFEGEPNAGSDTHFARTWDVEPSLRIAQAVGLLGDVCRDAELPTGDCDVLTALELVAVATWALEAIEVGLLVQAEETNASTRLRGHRLRRWWANQSGVCRAEASERVRVSCRLVEWFPLIAAALDRGEVSFAHAARIIRAATPEVLQGLAARQAALIASARRGTFEQFERDLLFLVDRLNPDGAAPDESRVNQVRVTNEFGNTRISGLLDPINGEIVANALKHSVDAIVRERDARAAAAAAPGQGAARPDPAESEAHAGPNAADRAAVARNGPDSTENDSTPADEGEHGRGLGHFGTSSERRGAADQASGTAAEPTSGTFDVRLELGHRIGALQAEGLVRICQTAVSANDLAGPIPTAHIDVIVRADDPTVGSTRNNETFVGESRQERLGCNAIYRVIELDADGVPLRMGRARRLATPDQRRTVFARDGGCVFPGCGAPPRDCDIHHVRRWSDGGSTDVDNLACLCRFHHSITHSTGWEMYVSHHTTNASDETVPAVHDQTSSTQPAREQPPTGADATGSPHFEWRTPTGATLRSQHRQPGAAA